MSIMPADVAGITRWGLYHGGNKRPSGGALSRFAGTGSHARRASAELRADHPALDAGQTQYPSRVFYAGEVPRVLVSGKHNAKVGAFVTKGPWQWMPIYTLTLEERATCPRACTLWGACYGNAMPFSRRVVAGPELEAHLDVELRALQAAHPRGFVVRLHVLGDFYSARYVGAWVTWLDSLPALHVFGYTAHAADSSIGGALRIAGQVWPARWAVRHSVAPDAPWAPGQATTIWRKPAEAAVPEGLVCPAQQDRTAACATCGLCWHPAAKGKRIVFIGHGMNRTKGGRTPAPPT